MGGVVEEPEPDLVPHLQFQLLMQDVIVLLGQQMRLDERLAHLCQNLVVGPKENISHLGLGRA